MKKNSNALHNFTVVCHDTSLKMRITFILFSFSIFQMIAATGFSQGSINLRFDNTPITSIIAEIKEQTQYKFFYINEEIDLQQRISIQVEQEALENVLPLLFKNTNITYAILGKQVVLKKYVQNKEDDEVYREIKGLVLDPYNNPLPGANVQIQGTTKGVITDFDGRFAIEVPEKDAILLVSYLGFETAKVDVTGQDEVTIQLKHAAAQLDDVILVGSRNPSRAAVATAVPVDVIDISTIKQSSPQITVNEILNYAAPSFTSNAQAIADGTDHVQPAALRGLGPDQLLVLINGKRRHKSALVNVNGSFGRGNVGTDLSSIPTNAIQRIEILKDGAAAQYGSDAIAGVINIVLKDVTNELSLELTAGANFTDEISPDNNVDGEKYNLGVNYGIPLNDKGFINLTGNFNFRGATNRMQEFTGNIFNGYNSIERVAAQNNFDLSLLPTDLDAIKTFAPDANLGARLADVNAANTIEEMRIALDFDNTDVELQQRDQERSDYNIRFGQSQLKGGEFFGNMEYEFDENLKVYAFGGLGFKNGNSAGFYRLPNQSRTYTPVYLNGFLPEINSNIVDKSLSFGISGKLNQWHIDISNTTGINDFAYRITNSSNASLQTATPFEADAGGFRYAENTSNLDLSRFYEDVFAGLNVALGAEYRIENYQINAGDEVSYELYNTNGKPHNSTDPTSTVPVDFYGRDRNAGIQVFPGFRPQNEVNVYRNSIAGYADIEADFTEKFRVSGAVRFEDFSDFGSTLNFKIASLLKATKAISLRGSVQTGFRAPSLHQIYFNSTSTITTNGVPQQVATFSNTSRIARLIGIGSLKEETSLGFTAGITAKIPALGMKFTLDGYRVDIDDRVVLTDEFSASGDELIQRFEEANATRAQFFANTINTRTQGVDIIVDHSVSIGTSTKLSNILAVTFSETEVTTVNIPDKIAEAGLSENYFSNTSRVFAESAVPNTNGNLSHNLVTGDKWNFFLRNSYFGEVEEATNIVDPNVDVLYSGRVITDLAVGFRLAASTKITVGANNIFDIYPDESDEEFQSGGRFRFSRRSKQFGYSGRFLFARLSFNLK
ncbi:TonB-dependent receptor domain-containing protein [Aquimarina sp. 2-A2]|uniref:TonB-dependent receptor domain-containing protein n=1 Tax=Aquimarina sp. 2-A2 TaxID=3382644 RepID=UPI00387EF69E